MLLDPAQTAGELYGSELVLRLQPGFVTGVVNTPDNINRIRQGLTRVLGRPIQIRLEPLEEDIREKNSKLDMLSQQFGNVTIR